jgi:hypothetical protein
VTAVVLRRRVGWATLGTACLFLLSLTIIGITAHAHFLISSCFQSDPCVVSGLTAAQEDTTRAFLAAVALLVGTLLLFLGVATAYTAPDWDEWGLRYLTRR